MERLGVEGYEVTIWRCGNYRCSVSSCKIYAKSVIETWAGVDRIMCPGCSEEMELKKRSGQ